MASFIVTLTGDGVPEDLAGQKLSPYGWDGYDINDLSSEVDTHGAVLAPVVESELFPALQVGLIDGVLVPTAAHRDYLLDLFGGGEYREVDIGEGGDVPRKPTSGDDVLVGTAGSDKVRLLAGDDHYGAAGGQDRIWGGDGHDTLFGGGSSDRLRGNDGNDALSGGSGGDTLTGDRGRDTLEGGRGRDDLSGGEGGDSLEGGKGKDTLEGGRGSDVLSGGASRDIVSGGKGKDTLDGGRGSDVLTGGAGSDLFVFETTGARNRDRITDFEVGKDRILLSDDGFRFKKIDGEIVIRVSGDERLTLEGVSSRKDLRDSIEFIDEPDPPVAGPASPALVFGLGGKFDQSINQSAWEGAENWSAGTGLAYAEFELQSEAQLAAVLERFARDEYDPIVTLGSGTADEVATAAAGNPDSTFVIIDGVVEQPNVTSYTFSIDEGAYLAGLFAAMASENGVVGFVGGMDGDLVRQYSTAFEQGVLATDPDAEVIVTMAGTTEAAWNDYGLGVEIAQDQMDEGADVIYTVAGYTGTGAMQRVSDEGRLSIGADIDLNHVHPGSVLTSIVKRVDVVVEEVFNEGSEIAGGVHTVGLAEGAVSYIRDEHNRGILTREMRDAADAAILDIIEGRIVVESYADMIV